ncbi:hypothetical protein SEA_HANK144_61 [Streptomyces phage Hank144]|uniref:HNH endonuclease n=1 Tax=Streptomyces phage Hank144 TaxID=2301573 RepID=A0A385DP79_9CAUD|nr:hypothetical protein KGG76_gp61 [Streptomyces phage Hank144]AXQ61114.1 hypothetical protein SEA_HANK144_61 [Streptomyces phage Hank144]
MYVERDPNDDRKWIVTCDCGATVSKFQAGVTDGGSPHCGDREKHPRGKNNSYGYIHMKVKRQRGSASKQVCVDCGGSAQDWSYDHKDPDEIVGPNRKGGESIFSLKVEHYEPRCKPCHYRFDNQEVPS